MTTRIGLLGAGNQSLEVEEFAIAAGHRVQFKAVSARYLEPSRDDLIDVRTTDDTLIATPVVAAVGAPGLKRVLIAEWGGAAYATLVSGAASVSPSATLGEGTVIAPLAAISTQARIGRHVLVNIGATVSHASTVGDFTTVSPGAHIAGDCEIGAGAFIGIGAVVTHNVRIAPGTIIGAGTVVVASLDVQGVYVGSPARLVRTTDGWLRDL